MSVPEHLNPLSVRTKANVYFDGLCVSHTLIWADGSKKSVGVIMPSSLVFNTVDPETMETVAGACSVKLPGSTEWQTFGVGEKFVVPGQARFEIKVEGEPYHYICHVG